MPGLRLIEMPRNRERGLCCGGGGGQMWMETPAKKRVNVIRVEEALESEPDVVGMRLSLLPCHGGSWAKGRGGRGALQVKDIAELVAESLE